MTSASQKGMELRMDRSEAVVETYYGIESRRPSKIEQNKPYSKNSSMEGGLRKNPADLTQHSRWPGFGVDAYQWDMARECFEGFPGNSSHVVGTRGSPSHAYVNDGSSSHQPRSYFEHGQPVKSDVHINGFNRGETLDMDAELLRKLDDLKIHFRRISDAPKRTGEMVFLDGEGLSEPFDDGFSYFSGLLTPGKPAPVYPHWIHHGQQHPVPPIPSRVMTSRPYHRYAKQSYLGHWNKYVDLNRDFPASVLGDSSLDRTLCNCFHCRCEHEQAPQSAQPTPFGTKGSVEYPVNSISYHHQDPKQICTRGHPGVDIPSPRSHDPRAHRRWPTESIGLYTGAADSQQKMIGISDKSKKHYHPISGGAPFITCCKCSELLTLPFNISMGRRKKPNLQCGSCSTVLLVEILGKRLVASLARQSSYLGKKNSHGEGEEKIASLRHCLSVEGMVFSGDGSAIVICSPARDNSSFHEKCEANEESDDRQVNMQKYEHSFGLAPSSSSEVEDVLDDVKLGTALLTSAENPLPHEESPALPSSKFTENLPNSSAETSEDQYAEERVLKETHWDFLVKNGAPREESVQDTATEAGTEYSFSDYLNTYQDSSGASEEADRSMAKKRDKFLFVRRIKKSIRDFLRSNEIVKIEKPGVVGNGHGIPGIQIP